MTERDERRLARVRTLADLLDRAFRIPGTRITFGLDPLIGLVPGLGDILTATVGGYVLLEAARSGASAAVLVRMVLNITFDLVLGSIPLIGDAMDVGFRANIRNVAILQRHLESPDRARAASRGVVFAAAAGFLAVLAAAAFAIGVSLRAVWSLMVR